MAAKMLYSFPSEVSVVDTNGDRLMDQMYAVDVNGLLWRFDVDNGTLDGNGDATITGGIVSDLSGTGADYRRFYHAPTAFMDSVVLGSGFRPGPQTTGIQDRYYLIRQPIGVQTVDGATGKVASEISVLYDSSTLGSIDATDTTLLTNGWYINLATNEKVYSTSTVFGQIFFKTYVPSASADPNACVFAPGTNYLYRVAIADGGLVDGQAVRATEASTLAKLNVLYGNNSSACSGAVGGSDCNLDGDDFVGSGGAETGISLTGPKLGGRAIFWNESNP